MVLPAQAREFVSDENVVRRYRVKPDGCLISEELWQMWDGGPDTDGLGSPSGACGRCHNFGCVYNCCIDWLNDDASKEYMRKTYPKEMHEAMGLL